MANIKSAKKSIEKSKNRRKYNISYRSMLRTFIKKVYIEINNKNSIAAMTAFVTVQKIIDKHARKGLIHKNKASRYKSAMHMHIRSINSINNK